MTPLKVVSYNVRRCQGLVGRRRDPHRVAAVLRRLDADLIGLQEVAPPGVGNDTQLATLAELTGHRSVPGPTLLRNDAPCGTALLSRYPVGAVRHHDLSQPGCEPRGALDVDLKLGQVSARVVVTHFGLRAAERRRQADRLLDILADDRAELLLLLGDINEWWPASRTLHKLHRRLGRRPAPRTFPAPLPLLCLDRIWAVGPALRGWRDPTVSRVWPTPLASDHLPLAAELSVAV